MRKYPENENDLRELKDLNVEDWQAEALKMNPSYVFWGPHEDYMTGGEGWNKSAFFDTWEESGPFELDDLNECVNFYFYIYRDNHECDECNGSGLNKGTQAIADSFYDFEEMGNRWCDSITQDEVESLVRAGRLRDFVPACYFDKDNNKWIGWNEGEKVEIKKPKMPLAEEVNKWNKKGLGHDAINRSILVKARAERLGVYGYCEKCNGSGIIYDNQKGKLGIVLWIIHPRKGASRAIEIKEIKREDLESVVGFLNDAKNRNNERFGKL
jgi:hypothetical protein